MSTTDSIHVRIARDEVLKFCRTCLQVAGADEDHGRQLSEVLTAADYRGHYSHAWYVRDIQNGKTERAGNPVILRQSPATAWVDGKNLLGPVVGNFCMDLAIKKAREVGIGWVVAKGSTHYGIAGWYAMRALQQGMIGISMTNATPATAPTRSKKGVMGTNPICVAAPAEDGDSFFLDMATSAVAMGKVEMCQRKNERLPMGWCQDAEGRPTDSPDAVMGGVGSMQPLGGPEITGGYKGYGLCTLVEILCGVLPGANYGPNVPMWADGTEAANLGHMFAAINPACFCDGFEGRLSDLMGILRGLEPADPAKPVLVAGDPEREHMAEVDREGGISYHKNLVSSLNELATKLGVAPLKVM